MRDIFRMLESDHRQIEELLAQLTAPAGTGQFDFEGRKRLFDHLLVMASRHEAAEEAAFWPWVRGMGREGRTLRDEGLRQEREAKFVLDAMRMAEDEATLIREATELAGLVAGHIRLEEQEVWPYVHRRRGRLGAAIVGVQFALARRTGPTRPHPRGPDKPAGIFTMGMVAATMDRVRDKLTGRRSRYPVRSETHDSPDPIVVLTAAHERIRSLIRRLEGEGHPDPGTVDELVRAWSAHDSVERQHLYPLLRTRVHEGNDLYGQGLSDHAEVTSELVEIERHPREGQYRRERIDLLIPKLLVHMDQEEGGLLPAVRAHLADEELADLGSALSRASEEAPTHPHPVLAGAGSGAKLARLVVRPMDSLRDRLHGRPPGQEASSSSTW